MKITEFYIISEKVSYTRRVPILRRWIPKKICDSLDEVKKFLQPYYDSWTHVRTKGRSTKILTFQSVPESSINESKLRKVYNGELISEYYHHIKIKPILNVDESQLEQKVQEEHD